MRHKLLILIALLLCIATLPKCAALWVADKTVDATLFAVGTGVKVGAGAAEATWDTGAAVADMAVPDDEATEEGDDDQ